MEPHRSKGVHVCGWKTNQALVTIMSFMVLSLVFLLAWAGNPPLLLVFTPETKISSLNWYFGGSEQAKAIWASDEKEELGVPTTIRRTWRLSTRLDQPRNTADEEAHEVSVDITVAGGVREKPVDLSPSWDNVMSDDLADFARNSGSAAYEKEGDTAQNNEENSGDRFYLKEEDGDSKPVYSSQTTELKDAFPKSDFSEKDTDVSFNTTSDSNVDDSLQNSSSTQMNSAAKLEVEWEATTYDDLESEVDASSKRANTTSSGVCDFTRGYWVQDQNRSLYEGKKCKAYLAGMWACREMNRPDFEYEKLRWQPDNCDLPAFSSQGFLERMKDKVMAFVGDSLGRQQFQSLMCMLTEEQDSNIDVEDIAEEWGFAAARGSVRGKGYVYRFTRTNTTVMFYWSATLSLLEYNRPDEEHGWAALHLDQPDVFLRDEIHKLDLLILNSGHHWNRGKFEGNKWHMYVDGKPVAGRKLSGIGEAYNFSMHKLVENLDAKLAQIGGRPSVFMRTLSPRHFKNGEWNTGGTCDNTRPQYGQKVIPYKGPATETVVDNAVSRSKRVRLLNITPLSSSREEAHISKYGKGKDSGHQDCLHWCLPGVPDTWNELVYGYLTLDSSLASNFLGCEGVDI